MRAKVIVVLAVLAVVVVVALTNRHGGSDGRRNATPSTGATTEPVISAGPRGQAGGDSGAPSSTAPSSPPSTSPAPVEHGHDGGMVVQDPAPSLPSIASGEQTGLGFAQVWMRYQLNKTAWLTGVAPYCTPDYAEQLKGFDHKTVPVRKLTGQALGAITAPGVLTVSIDTDAGTLQLFLISGRTGTTAAGPWRVANLALGGA